ncbi:M23 family metallopeptidase [Mucilaginibacter myungsuensis]|uniref:M23 family metallopeptidase n=1 Tax=Mucilaginibacter myungsuensis TaxID=649104 RepID=A0A929PVN3_9SPHI|nr:M23 family metallopeptidase [Mucilaginibacter myungsuensis]MBE9661309.1 M23 family metallopeptidase [Mucilaginibacter myungsuensis]MDN3597452.1 M23 family metallopeptidase [Mucilaginibacter myungsuensis]
MKSKKKDISTIMILNKDRVGAKTIQVNTKHISRFWHYVTGILLLVVSLTLSIFYLHGQNQQKDAEKQQLIAQITKLKGHMATVESNAKETQSAQTYIQAIENKLQTINSYLRKRGLPGFSNKKVGGSGGKHEEEDLTDKEKYTLYDEYLGRLAKTIAYTPMGYPRLSSFNSIFGYRSDPFNGARAEYHPGIDFKGNHGDPVKATATGTIVHAGWFGGYGNCVRIRHANNLETLYGHLSKITVREGQKVTVGDVVGKVGSTGHSTGSHLHYEVRRDGKPINPVKFLSISN